MIPANLDAAIRTCVRVAEYDCVSGFEAARLRDAAAALTDCREKLAQMCRTNDEMRAEIAALRAERDTTYDARLIAWVHPDWIAGKYHLSTSPVTTYPQRGWIPLYTREAKP